jgi:PhnB protein
MSDTAEQATTQSSAKVLGGLVTYLQVDGALKVAEFYQRAFGAETVFFHPPDEQGRTMHVHLHVNGSSLMLGDAYPEYGHGLEKPQGYTLTLMPDDIDTAWKRAVEAGCEVVMPLEVMFWGDRYGQLRDPFGVNWAMNAPVKPA